jgi:two-component system response regulator (stage 0 sporulation protein A)
MNTKLRRLLYDWGVPPHVKGFRYIASAVEIDLEDPEALDRITKVLYPKIAKMYNTTPTRVERAIRHAKELGLYNMSFDQIQKYFGKVIRDGSVPNSLYLTVLSQTYKELIAKEENKNG